MTLSFVFVFTVNYTRDTPLSLDCNPCLEMDVHVLVVLTLIMFGISSRNWILIFLCSDMLKLEEQFFGQSTLPTLLTRFSSNFVMSLNITLCNSALALTLLAQTLGSWTGFLPSLSIQITQNAYIHMMKSSRAFNCFDFTACRVQD